MITFLNRKWIKFFVLLAGTILFTLGLFVYQQVNYQNWVERNNNFYISNQKVNISIRSNYDGLKNHPSTTDFFKQENSLQKMRNVYKNLNNSDQFTYLEIMEQQFEYKGNKIFSSNFIVNGEQGYTDAGDYYTSLKSVQISSKVYNMYNLSDKISMGSGLKEDDYVLKDNENVKVILGSDYQDVFQIGDIFQVKYLVYGELTCEVVGFLNTGTSIEMEQNTLCLDDYIVAPALNVNEGYYQNNELFTKILYSAKTDCDVEFDYLNMEHYKSIVKKLEKCFSDADIDYRCQSNIIIAENQIHVSTIGSIIIAIFGIIIGIISLVLYEKYTDFDTIKEQDQKSKISNTLHLLLEIAINGVISFAVIYLFLYSVKLQNSVRMVRTPVVLFCIVTFLITQYRYNHKGPSQ